MWSGKVIMGTEYFRISKRVRRVRVVFCHLTRKPEEKHSCLCRNNLYAHPLFCFSNIWLWTTDLDHTCVKVLFINISVPDIVLNVTLSVCHRNGKGSLSETCHVYLILSISNIILFPRAKQFTAEKAFNNQKSGQWRSLRLLLCILEVAVARLSTQWRT